MNLKKLLSLIIISSMFLISSCGQTTSTSNQNTDKKIKDGGSIVFQIGSDPQAMNPLYGSDRVTMTINNSLFSPLFIINGDNCEYFLAESVTPSKDFMNYTLKLKPNLKWHDGQKITADDVVFTIEKILDTKQNTFLRELFIIDGKPVEVKKVDDLTVDFKLPKLTMAFMGSLAQISPIPKHIYENEASIEKSPKNETPIGSGPFKMKEFKKGESLTLERFDDYFNEKAHLDTIVFRVIADNNSANAALENNELSAKYIEPKDVDKLKSTGNFQIVTFDEGMLNNLVFNFNIDILKKKEVRQAIAYAINRDEIIKASYLSSEYAKPAYSVFTPDVLFYTTETNHFDYNVEKAKELLAKSGVKNLKLRLLYMNGSKSEENEALILQQSLKNIGIDLKLMPIERGAFINKILDTKSKDYDLVFNGYVMGSEPDSYKGVFMTGQTWNISRYSNKEIDAMWDKAVTETDKQKRGTIYKTIQQNIVDDMPLYPMTYPKSIVAINKKYSGIQEAKPVPIFMFQDLSKLYINE